MQRTEDQIISRAPIKVILGETAYEIKPLTITKQQAWRQKLATDMGLIVDTFSGKVKSAADFNCGLRAAMFEAPEKMAQLVFDYAPYLPKDVILDEEKGATEEQLAGAFDSIMTLAFPFLKPLKTVTQLMSTR